MKTHIKNCLFLALVSLLSTSLSIASENEIQQINKNAEKLAPKKQDDAINKLEKIIIPKFSIQDGTTFEMAAFKFYKVVLAIDKAKNPKNSGIGIIFRTPNGEKFHRELGVKRLDLQNKTAREVLEQICDSCDPKMSFKIGRVAVSFEAPEMAEE